MMRITPIQIVKWRLRGFSEKEAKNYISRGVSLIQALNQKNTRNKEEDLSHNRELVKTNIT